jgi:hypothetical protein
MRPEISTLVEGLRELCPDGVAGVDFETYYDKTCSLKVDGNWAYCRHPDWDCYLVSIFAPSAGVFFVGSPKDAPWDQIAGMVWLSHNSNFDRHVYERLVEVGTIKAVPYSVWHDTASLSVYCHLPRNLKGAVKYAFGFDVSKASRTNANGKRWPNEFTEEERAAMLEYAGDDAVFCWCLWAQFASQWPEHERQLSLHTGEMEFRGIPVDVDLIEKNIGILKNALWKIEQTIPWLTDKDAKGKPYALGSPRAIERECFKRGVPAPSTTAIKNKDFLDWLDEYGEHVPALMDLSRHRRINRALKAYETLRRRIRQDGRAALALMYFGADKTGRWSGTSGFNLQAIAKSPLLFDGEFSWVEPSAFGPSPENVEWTCDMRACFVASKGRQLAIPDLSQIEPRVMAWVIRDHVFLEACRSGQSPYEAHARASMGWNAGKLKAEDPMTYALAKARVLALGYGAGWMKFIEMAFTYLGSEEVFLAIFGKDTSEEQREAFLEYNRWLLKEHKNKAAGKVLREWPTLTDSEKNVWVNSWYQVKDFRTNNPLIANSNLKNGPLGIWKKMDDAFRAAEAVGTYEVELPSGRSLMYYSVTSAKGWSARQGNPDGRRTYLYGGKIVENMIQAISRDVFALGILRLEAAGYEVLFTVHDEVIVDMPDWGSLEEITDLLARPPEWAKSLPVAAEGQLSPHYLK